MTASPSKDSPVVSELHDRYTPRSRLGFVHNHDTGCDGEGLDGAAHERNGEPASERTNEKAKERIVVMVGSGLRLGQRRSSSYIRRLLRPRRRQPGESGHSLDARLSAMASGRLLRRRRRARLSSSQLVCPSHRLESISLLRRLHAG